MLWNERTLRYIESLRIDEKKYSLFHNSGESLYGCCFALMTKYYLSDFKNVNKESFLRYINSFQDEATGFYIAPETKRDELTSKHSWDHVLMHLAVHVLPTLILLGGKPRFKFKFLENFKDISYLEDWLNLRDFSDAWYEGNYLLFVGQLLCYEMEQGDERAKKALDFWFEWLDRKVDPQTGLWGTDGKCDVYNAIYGAYHQFLVYYYLNRSIKFHDKVIDATLKASNAIGSGACQDVDIIDILVNGYKIMTYRRDDIKNTLQNGVVEKVLECQNDDGGFTYARMNSPFSMMGIKRTSYPMPNSHLFATWFRVHTLALLNEIVEDPRINPIDFRFNTFCSMGWHRKTERIIHNHFKEQERMALQLDQKDTPILYMEGAGNIGGPSVKLGRLGKYFKTDSNKFSILYTVSSQVPVEICRKFQKQNKKIVFNCDGILFPAFRPNYEELNEPLKELHQLADYVLYQSNFSKMGAEKFLGERTNPSAVVYNAVDTQLFRYVERPKNRCNLLITGNIYIRHRVEPVIRAFPEIKKYIPQAELIIAGPLSSVPGGQGNVFLSDHNEIIKLCHEVGVGFKYIPQYTQEQAPSIYAEGDIFVHLKHLDWCPNVVLEAMSTGLPVVHAGNGGTTEIVRDCGVSLEIPEDWVNIPLYDIGKLANSIIYCYERRFELGEKARKNVEDNFNIDLWIEKHKKIFYQLLS